MSDRSLSRSDSPSSAKIVSQAQPALRWPRYSGSSLGLLVTDSKDIGYTGIQMQDSCANFSLRWGRLEKSTLAAFGSKFLFLGD